MTLVSSLLNKFHSDEAFFVEIVCKRFWQLHVANVDSVLLKGLSDTGRVALQFGHDVFLMFFGENLGHKWPAKDNGVSCLFLRVRLSVTIFD
jgi:hypothetical protein